MSATGEDRAAARKLIGYHITPHVEAMISLGEDQWAAYVEDVAEALAAEREKARAPFLALADELDRQAVDMELVRADAVAAKPADPATVYADSVARNVGKEWTKIADRIRCATEEASA